MNNKKTAPRTDGGIYF